MNYLNNTPLCSKDLASDPRNVRMSTGRSSVMDALPRASFITYFHQSAELERGVNSVPPAYTKHSPLLSHIPRNRDADSGDDESQIGLYDKHNAHNIDFIHENGEKETRNGVFQILVDALGLICYILLVLVLVLNLDMFLSQWDVGPGLMSWSLLGIRPQSISSEVSLYTGEMSQF